MQNISTPKKCILSSTKVRRDARGNLWISRLSVLKKERKHTIPRHMNQQELDNKSQAESSC